MRDKYCRDAVAAPAMLRQAREAGASP